MHISDLSAVTSGLRDAIAIGGLLGDASAYHLDSGGKAWRARLALQCGHALDLSRQDSIGLAIACELVHQASVVHDDIQDGSALRRGRDSVAARYGAATALCVGDHLLVSAFTHIAPLPRSPELMRLFSRGVSQMAAAQAEEFNPGLWQDMTWPRYEALIAGKAGVMLILPIAGAALIAGLDASDIDQLSSAARNLGMAYQAGDDIADLTDDLSRGALNGVIASGLERADEAGRARWRERLGRARERCFPQSEARLWAAGLQPETAIIQDWAGSLPGATITALRAGCSPRCLAMLPVLEEAADWLARCAAADMAGHHAA